MSNATITVRIYRANRVLPDLWLAEVRLPDGDSMLSWHSYHFSHSRKRAIARANRKLVRLVRQRDSERDSLAIIEVAT